MKKLLFVLLTAALAMPMTAQVKGLSSDCRTAATPSFSLKHVSAQVANRDEVPAGYASVTLAAADVWQDGSGYQMLLDADATAYGTIIPETGGLTTGGDAPAGVYDEFEYKIPENADGSMTTTNMVCDNAVTLLIPAGVYDWCITNPTPGDRIWIASSNGNIPGRYDNFEFVDGGIYTFSVTLGGSNDRVDLEIYDPLAPVMPMNVTADENGNVAWENDHDPAFNLRYRVYDPNVAQTLYWGFETDADLEGWTIEDADGDGYGWYLNETSDYANSGNCSLFSFSYWSGVGATTSDNWLISPEVPLGGTLTFWTANRSGSYLDKIAVYARVADGEWVKLTDDITPGTTFEEVTVEIPEELRGMGNFAFRHYECTDQWAIFIDDITYAIPGNEPAEWIVVEGVEGNNYAIEGLEDGVTYEVQVQAIGVDGRTTDWTEPVLFTYSDVTGVNELVNGKAIAGVRYFNVAGQEMQEANGVTIVVTTYTDGTTSAAKVIK
ncbi:MAG: DUF2436 domain-containing protein [Muribaculaceae bacterium]|nr:DUF2436 domain-containing protein [Muribaculaceae bacterium]